MTRGHWPSRFVFILAAVGSAAGLGNIWRFPFLAYEHGGAAFIVALIVANIVVGIPLLILELGVGQQKQLASPDAFGSVRKGFRYVGWVGLAMIAIVMSYYMAVMAWSVKYLGAAFTNGWGDDTSGYFFNSVLQISEGPVVVGGLAIPLLISFVIAWALVYFCVWKGVHSVSKVVVWTATIPFVILGILLIRAVTLPGAGAGIAAYLIPTWSALGNMQLWLAAFSQVFFSLSVALGIMVAYGSFNDPDTEIVKSAWTIALGNFLVSFISGFVVFGTLGFMASQKGVAVAEVVASGPGLIFVTIPQALSLMPVFPTLFGVLFFVTVLLLGIDSAFSILEGVAAPIRDRLPHISTQKIALVTSGILFVLGLPFITKAGLYYLDIVDHFIVNYGVVIVGICEALLVGWFWKGDSLMQFINERSQWKLGAFWNFAVRFFIPIFLVILLVANLVAEFKEPYEGYPLWALGWIGVGSLVVSVVAAVILDRATARE